MDTNELILALVDRLADARDPDPEVSDRAQLDPQPGLDPEVRARLVRIRNNFCDQQCTNDYVLHYGSSENLHLTLGDLKAVLLAAQ